MTSSFKSSNSYLLGFSLKSTISLALGPWAHGFCTSFGPNQVENQGLLTDWNFAELPVFKIALTCCFPWVIKAAIYGQAGPRLWFHCPQVCDLQDLRYSSISGIAKWGWQRNSGPWEDPPLLKQKPQDKHFVLRHLNCSGIFVDIRQGKTWACHKNERIPSAACHRETFTNITQALLYVVDFYSLGYLI